MALVIVDRVRETTTSTGTGSIALAGPYSGYQAFSTIGNGNSTYYAIIDSATGAWEVGIGTYNSTGNTLSRDTVLSSSTGGTIVSFVAGVKDVILTQPAARSVLLNQAGTAAAVSITGSAATLTTPRTISSTGDVSWSTTFDGSANATGTATLSNTGVSAGSYTNASFTVDAKGRITTAASGSASGIDPIAAALVFGGQDSQSLSLLNTVPNGVVYLDDTGSATTSSGLTFDGANLALANGAIRLPNSYEIGWGTNSSYIVGNSSSNVIQFSTNSAEQMRLNSTGLGIGTNSPGAKLHASSAANTRGIAQNTNPAGSAGGVYWDMQSAAATAGSAWYRAVRGLDESGNLRWVIGQYGAPEDTIGFYTGTSGTERMRLDASGNLGLGVTPSAWGSAWRSIDSGTWGGYYSTNGGYVGIAANAYTDGTSWKYKGATTALRYEQTLGTTPSHAWYVAGTGTQGQPISFTQAMTLDASGQLGIGTSSPTTKLDVLGAGDSEVRIRAASDASLIFSETAANKNWKIKPSAGDLYFQYSGTAYNSGYSSLMTLTASGNLGLGVAPSGWGSGWTAWQTKYAGFMGSKSDGGSYLLDNAYFDGSNFRYLAPGPRGASNYSQYNGAHSWSVSSAGTAGNVTPFTQAMTLDASGNLLVGYTAGSPVVCKVEADSVGIGKIGVGSTTSRLRFAPRTAGYSVMGIYNSQGASGGGLVFNTGDNADPSANTALMTLDNAGNLLVGTTSSTGGISGANPRLAVVSANTSSHGCVIKVTGSGYHAGLIWNADTVGNNGFFEFGTEATYTVRGSIYYDRAAGQTKLAATSDQRLKQNIVDAPAALPVIEQIKVRQYEWKETGTANIGFIAQELHGVVERAVAVGEDNEDGSIKRPWGVDNGTLVPYLVKAIQEQQAIIEDLKARVEALETN